MPRLGQMLTLRIDAKCVGDERIGEKCVRRADPLGLSVLANQNIVADTNRHVEIVQRHDFQLVTHVEMVGRLVKDENLRFLCQGTGHHDALTLAARQCAEVPIGESVQVEYRQDTLNDPFVACSICSKT